MTLQPKPRKGGRYTKIEQNKRREQVYDLHFEYSYPANQIAKKLNVNRNTINNDISYLYSQHHSDVSERSYDDGLNKQFLRFESQRSRLRMQLDHDLTIQDRLKIEKIILDLDWKISSLFLKVATGAQKNWSVINSKINEFMKYHNFKTRFLMLNSIFKLPEKSQDEIFAILKKNHADSCMILGK